MENLEYNATEADLSERFDHLGFNNNLRLQIVITSAHKMLLTILLVHGKSYFSFIELSLARAAPVDVLAFVKSYLEV